MSLLHRKLRRQLTEPEQIVWKALRNRQMAPCKFRRQHPIGPYVVDFVCLEARLVVELDGKVHDEQVAYDEHRDRFLQSQGYSVIRLRNIEVYKDPASALSRIREALDNCSATSLGKTK